MLLTDLKNAEFATSRDKELTLNCDMGRVLGPGKWETTKPSYHHRCRQHCLRRACWRPHYDATLRGAGETPQNGDRSSRLTDKQGLVGSPWICAVRNSSISCSIKSAHSMVSPELMGQGELREAAQPLYHAMLADEDHG